MQETIKLGRAGMARLDRAYNFARFLSGDAQAAEHMAYAAFAHAGRGSETKILKMVRNGYRTWLTARRKIRRQSGRPQNGKPVEKRLPDPTTASVLRSDEAPVKIGSDGVRAAIAALPRRLREVLVLREFAGLSYKEIAEVTSLTTGEIMSRLAAARRMLGQAINQRAPTRDAHRAQPPVATAPDQQLWLQPSGLCR
jgi:RNA polymerase sigma-70 factor (ECF subfamily)